MLNCANVDPSFWTKRNSLQYVWTFQDFNASTLSTFEHGRPPKFQHLNSPIQSQWTSTHPFEKSSMFNEGSYVQLWSPTSRFPSGKNTRSMKSLVFKPRAISQWKLITSLDESCFLAWTQWFWAPERKAYENWWPPYGSHRFSVVNANQWLPQEGNQFVMKSCFCQLRSPKSMKISYFLKGIVKFQWNH